MRIDINNDWLWTDSFSEEMVKPSFGGGSGMKSVRLPHTVSVTPLNFFDEHIYQMESCYRKILDVPAEWEGKVVLLTFDAVAHEAEVFCNGESVAKHSCGYTAFTVDLTSRLNYGAENVIAVRCDSREDLNIPPFGFVIDYMTYGGIYREVHIDVREKSYIRDVYASAGMDGNVRIKTEIEGEGELSAKITDAKSGEIVYEGACDADSVIKVEGVKLWSVDDPNLYELTMTLRSGTGEDTYSTRIGFRDAVFRADGFYLNGGKIKIRGLNRHQCWPYVGYAMPESMQRLDADILKNELGVNAVRTSHYPQSQHFIDRCDELGLLVFAEIPGWQNIGDDAWKEQAVTNTREMVTQYRNHPSIILWGVRINESVDCDELYEKTNKAAHELDPVRQTSGVRYLKKSSLLEDVYAYNDFSHSGSNPGCEPKKNVTSDMNKPFLISEYNGHMYPTKAFDDELHRQEHALRHCNVLDSVMANHDIAGSFGWCMFDYNTHMDFGSGDRICYHGVMDAFRNPKLAAAFYASQQEETPVLEIGSNMDIGDYPASVIGDVWLFTNADSVKLYKNGQFIAEFSETPFKNLPHGPMPMQAETFISEWGDRVTEWRFDAVKDGRVVKSVIRAANSELRLETVPSSTTLTEGDTYDMAAVRIRIVDKWGHTAPFVQLPLLFEVEGAAQLVGPAVITAEGGMGGAYIRTTGEAGKAMLTVRCPGLETIRIAFDVIK